MGYGIVLHSNDRLLAATDPTVRSGWWDQLAEHLVGQHYPSAGIPGLVCGAVSVVGAWHSTTRQLLTVTATGARPSGLTDHDRSDNPYQEPVRWVGEPTATEQADAVRTLRHHPDRVGDATLRVLAGLDAPVPADASLWVLYADSLTHTPVSELGAVFDSTFSAHSDPGLDRCGDGTRIGHMAGALRREGRLYGWGPVLVWWWGNKLWSPEELDHYDRQMSAANR